VQTCSYSNVTDNFKVDKLACKCYNLHKIHENYAQNLQVTRAEVSFFAAEF